MKPAPEPFVINVPDAVLDDLQRRLVATRLPDDFANDDWRYGANAGMVAMLVEHWRTRYRWRERERAMNRLSHYRVAIDGLPIHFVHAPSPEPDARPLILTHGWPWTFWDYQKVIGPLSDPAAYGGDPADAFHVVVPSLPGYAFSTPLRTPGINFWKTAELWVELMAQLGYPRFAAQGGDWGAFIAAQLGHKHADRIIGVHLHTPAPLDFMTGGIYAPEDFGPEDAHLIERMKRMGAEETGYFLMQRTKPQTPAVALADSPAGLLAWIVEKRRSWSDCGGDVLSRFSADELIDTVMLYWVTNSYHSSARFYYEASHDPWAPSHDRRPVVEAPVAVPLFPRELTAATRRWADRYYNLHRWTPMPAGGHFAPMEEPDLLVADIRDFLRDRT